VQKAPTRSTYYSIIIVGTFLDHPAVNDKSKTERMMQIRALAKNYGLEIPQYYEVSCETLENIEEVKEVVFKTALSHSYMGERVPKSYLSLEDYLSKRRKECKEQGDIPVISVEELFQRFPERQAVLRGLNLLTLWGDCVYFSEPEELSTVVILDPRFLTKDILAQLFNPSLSTFIKEGVFAHKDLPHVWPALKHRDDFDALAETLWSLMEKFEVCFTLSEDLERPFFDRRSIIPSKLPEKSPKELSDWWILAIPYGLTHIERTFQFNTIPKEMVGRLFVRFHRQMEVSLFWRTGLYFDRGLLKSIVIIDLAKNQLYIAFREKGRKECVELMNTMADHVIECANLYPGLTFRQMVKSPEAEDALIDLEEIRKDYEKPVKERMFLCPKTRNLLDSEKLMLLAGLIDEAEKPLSMWWSFGDEVEWKRHADEDNSISFYTVHIMSDGQLKRADLLQKMWELLKQPIIVHNALAVYNPSLFHTFKIKSETLNGNLSKNARLFKKDDWKLLRNKERRENFFENFKEWVHSYSPLYANHKLEIIPMSTGVEESQIVNVCKYGVSVRDGYLGTGVYVTNSVNYASIAPFGKDSSERWVVLAAVIPGNSFPVIEHLTAHDSFKAKSCRGGYQSHVSVVSKVGGGVETPVEENYNPQNHVFQLAVFQDAQVLPLFIFQLKS